jgi:hypothetical protein
MAGDLSDQRLAGYGSLSVEDDPVTLYEGA